MPYDACGMARITAQLSSFALACPNLTALWLVPLVTVIWPRLRFSRANWDGSNDGLNLKNLRSCKRKWLKYVKMEMNSNQLWFGHQFIDSSLNLRLTLISYAILTKSSGPVFWWRILQIFGAFASAGGFSHAFLDAAEKSLSQFLSRSFCGVIWCNLTMICLISVHWNWNCMNNQFVNE